MKIGIIARCDRSGLANQTLNLCKMLQPDKVLLVDSTPFTGSPQDFDSYSMFNVDKTYGFPTKKQMLEWSKGLTHVLTAETFYWTGYEGYAIRHNIKTVNICNYEFLDHMVSPRTAPTLFIMPSTWKYKEVRAKYPNTIQLKQPLQPNDFKEARQTNFERDGRRFLHIVGNYASKDRNGTKSVLEALQHTQQDFELVIRTQKNLDFWTNDKRVTVDSRNLDNYADLYKDFDAMIMPRRYGGNCMPMQEALMSGLPVIMTDIEPNEILPKQWLVTAKVTDKLLTRMTLDVYSADPLHIARKIDWLCNPDIVNNLSDAIHTLSGQKALAFEIGMEYAADNLKQKYMEVLESL